MLVSSGLIHEFEKCTIPLNWINLSLPLKVLSWYDYQSNSKIYQFVVHPNYRKHSRNYLLLHHLAILFILVLNLLFYDVLKMFQVVLKIFLFLVFLCSLLCLYSQSYFDEDMSQFLNSVINFEKRYDPEIYLHETSNCWPRKVCQVMLLMIQIGSLFYSFCCLIKPRLPWNLIDFLYPYYHGQEFSQQVTFKFFCFSVNYFLLYIFSVCLKYSVALSLQGSLYSIYSALQIYNRYNYKYKYVNINKHEYTLLKFFEY